jgi:hypothetical protein
MPLFNVYRKKVLDHINGVSALTAEAHLHMGLTTTTPTAGGTNITEPTGNNYSRIQVTNSGTTWDAAVDGTADNGAALTWPVASGSWGVCTYVVAWAADNTALVWYAPIDGGTGVSIAENDEFSIPAGDCDWTCT